ncbi:MAG: hypothetical protein M1434_14765 [Chloroflexi bacterium]|nr:hypothetical protein [Chloroflexota bacterium]MCL5275981.1 hypothetical protein [Chloroflexota bacterium]
MKFDLRRSIATVLVAPALLLSSACSVSVTLPDTVQRAINRAGDQILTQVQTNAAPTDQQPSKVVAELADAAAMTDQARAIFFAAQPVIDTDRAAFARHCGVQDTRDTVELGCYTSDNRIYIMNLGDARFYGEMVVVAAHEMLHAAYDALTPSEQAGVDKLLQAQLAQTHSSDLAQRLREYRISEPGQQDNELHSIFGAEFAPLNAGLEQYYRAYFANRAVVVADAQAFDRVFGQLKANISDLTERIRQMRIQIQRYRAQRNIAAYNRLVPQLNELITQYNQAVQDYNALSRDLLGQESPVPTQ